MTRIFYHCKTSSKNPIFYQKLQSVYIYSTLLAPRTFLKFDTNLRFKVSYIGCTSLSALISNCIPLNINAYMALHVATFRNCAIQYKHSILETEAISGPPINMNWKCESVDCRYMDLGLSRSLDRGHETLPCRLWNEDMSYSKHVLSSIPWWQMLLFQNIVQYLILFLK